MKIAAVIVTHNPPAGFPDRVKAVIRQCALTIIVDNASSDPAALTSELEADSDLVLIRNEQNKGIAEALNQGIQYAADQHCDWVLLLDHDSTVAADMVMRLSNAIPSSHTSSDQIFALVPRISYGHPDIRCRWPFTPPHRKWRFEFIYGNAIDQPHPVDLAISSGMMIQTSNWKRLGGFDGSLFIDLVDTEMCLRARRNRLRVLAVPDAVLQHQLGDVEQRKLLNLIPVYPTHHSATRHYYIARNRCILARRYAVQFPSWAFYELLGGLKLTIKVLLFESRRWEKFRALMTGSWDGLRWKDNQPAAID